MSRCKDPNCRICKELARIVSQLKKEKDQGECDTLEEAKRACEDALLTKEK